MLNQNAKGYVLAILAGATFGLIPIFTIPILKSGMGYTSLIFWRFLFGSGGMLLMLLYRQNSLRLSWRDFKNITVLSLYYIASAALLFTSYRYISSGVATSLIYTNPIWCSLLGIIFLHHHITWRLALAIVLAVGGVAMLSGVFTNAGEVSLLGLLLGLGSGLSYGVYLLILPLLKISKMPALKLTFYIFFNSMLLTLAYGVFVEGGIEPLGSTENLYNIIMLGLIPTAFSNICLTMALRATDSTTVAVLGAAEPLTAMTIGITVLKEPYDAFTITGGLLVLVAIWILIGKRRAKKPQT